MSAAYTSAFSSVEAHCSGRMEKAGREKCTVARNQSYDTRPVRPLICVLYVKTHMRVLVSRGRQPEIDQDTKVCQVPGRQPPVNSPRVCVRRFGTSLNWH